MFLGVHNHKSSDYWGYFEPIRQNMPKNCSADIEAVISHVDHVFTTGSAQEKQALKDLFGIGDVTHLDDAAGSCKSVGFSCALAALFMPSPLSAQHPLGLAKFAAIHRAWRHLLQVL